MAELNMELLKKWRNSLKEMRKPTDHLEYCKKFIAQGGLVLDVGAGRGKFLCGLLSSGIKAHGIEINPVYIAEAEAKAKELGGEISIIAGRAEALPYPDSQFDFVNCAEVTEHIDDPLLACREILRVLKPGGKCYTSFHNRFGIRDLHYHLYFINWMPRAWAEKVLGWLGKEKNDGEAGRQKLATMCYYSFNKINQILAGLGFEVKDTREEKVKQIFGEDSAATGLYRIIRQSFYPNVFHFLLTKKIMNSETENKYELCILGGAGHIGLPLGVAFAQKGVKTVLFDINRDGLEKIKNGIFPFKEAGGEEALLQAIKSGNLFVSSEPEAIGESRNIIMVIGTPVDEYLNPDFRGIMRTIDKYLDFFKDGQTLILRSTVFPGTSEKIQRYFKERGKGVNVAFCPERIVEGQALEEFKLLPQIISAFDEKTLEDVKALFGRLTSKKMVLLEPIEAELAKLFTNSWRYIKFAAANQFFMIAAERGLNYHKILRAMNEDYERNKDLASPGFAAGPCLFKDTMQLAAFNNNNFFIGHAAMLVNEGLPNFLIQQLIKEHGDISNKTIGILGMTFKAESDDHRDSLSFKLKKIAETKCRRVLCHDCYMKDESFKSVEDILRHADIIFLATPHAKYKEINPLNYPDKIFIDVWNFFGK